MSTKLEGGKGDLQIRAAFKKVLVVESSEVFQENIRKAVSTILLKVSKDTPSFEGGFQFIIADTLEKFIEHIGDATLIIIDGQEQNNIGKLREILDIIKRNEGVFVFPFSRKKSINSLMEEHLKKTQGITIIRPNGKNNKGIMSMVDFFNSLLKIGNKDKK